jgi:hypothetical protein
VGNQYREAGFATPNYRIPVELNWNAFEISVPWSRSGYPTSTEGPMTVTLNLPPDIERAFQGEAQARGLSLDEFLSEMVLPRAEHVVGQSAVAASLSAQLVREEGVPVLRTGQPIGISVVDETLDRIRRERESAILGRSN